MLEEFDKAKCGLLGEKKVLNFNLLIQSASTIINATTTTTTTTRME